MARKEKDKFTEKGVDEEEFDFDELDAELEPDDMDFDDPFDEPAGKRKPTKGFNPKELIQDAASVDTLRQVSRKVGDEFHSVGRAYDTTIDTISEMDRYKDAVLKDIAPTMHRAKRVARRYLPRVESILPTKIYDRLDNLLKGEKEEEAKPDKEQVRRDTIGTKLAEVFESQEGIRREQYIRDKSDEMIKEKLDTSRHGENVTVLSQIRNILKTNQLFFEGTFRRYLMKSLELKYKQLFLTKDILEQTQLQVRLLDSKLSAISHNTGLPDSVKRQKSEEAMMVFRERMFGKAAESLGDWTKNFRTNLMSNIKENIFEKFSGTFNDLVGQTAEALETADEMREMEEEMGMGDKRSPLARLTASMIKRLMVDSGFVSLRAGVGEQRFKDFDSTVKELTEQAPHRIREFAEHQEGMLGDILKAVVPTLSSERGTLDNVFAEKGGEEVPFDVVTRQAIVEIIPGFLSKIHQQASTIAKSIRLQAEQTVPKGQIDKFRERFSKETDTEELVYDRHAEDFIKASEFKQRTMDDLFGSREERTADLDKIVSQMYAGYVRHGGDDAEFEAAMPDLVKFVTNITKHAEVLHPKRILKYLNGGELSGMEQAYMNSLFTDVPSEAREKLAGILAKTFFKDTTPEKEQVDTDVTKGVGPLLRQLAIERDRYVGELQKLNVYGGKRHLGELLDGSDETVDKEVEKLTQEFTKKHGEKFTKDPTLVSKYQEEVRQLRKRSGINHETIREIQSDVDTDRLLSGAREQAGTINQRQSELEKKREMTDGSNMGQRVRDALKEEYRRKTKPVKDAYEKIVPEKTRDKIKKFDATGRAKKYWKKADKYAEDSGFKDKAREYTKKADKYAEDSGFKDRVKKARETINEKTAGVRSKSRRTKDRIFGEIFTAAYKADIPTNYKDFVAKAKEFAEKHDINVNEEFLKQVWELIKKGKDSGIHKPVDPGTAHDIADDLGTETRDAVQVSGPGVYYQGAEKELHVPLTEDTDTIRDQLEQVLDKFQETKNRATKEASWKINEFKTNAGQQGIPTTSKEAQEYLQSLQQQMAQTYDSIKDPEQRKEQLEKLKSAVKKKEEELELTKKLGDLREKVEQELTDRGITDRVVELRKRIETTAEELELAAKYTEVQQNLTDTTKRLKKLAEWKYNEARQLMYYYGVDEKFQEWSGKAKGFFDRAVETATDPDKRRNFVDQTTQKASTAKRNVKNMVDRADGEIRLGMYRQGWGDQYDDLTNKAKGLRDRARGTYQSAVETATDPDKRRNFVDQAGQHFHDAKRGVKNKAEWKLSELQHARYYHDADGKAAEFQDQVGEHVKLIKNALSKGATSLVNTVTDQVGQRLSGTGESAVESRAEGGESPLQTSVNQIKQMLQDQFTQTNEVETTKVHILNQLLMTSTRGEIMEHGDATAKRKMSIWARMAKVPAALGRGVKGGVSGYFNTLGKLYRGMFTTTRRYLPGMINKTGEVLKGGIGTIGDQLPKVGDMYAKILKGYGNLIERGVKGLTGIGGKGIDKIKEMFTKKDKFVDVYRKDEVDLGQPLLKGVDIEAGNRYIYGDGKPVKDSYSVKGPVFDAETKQLLVSSADLKHGLVDYKNNELVDSPSLAGIGLDLGTRAIKGYGKFLKGTAELGADLTGRAFGAITGLFGKGGGMGDEKTLNEHVTQHLVRITELLQPVHDHYLSKQIRSGSYKDFMQQKEEDDEEKIRASDVAKRNAKRRRQAEQADQFEGDEGGGSRLMDYAKGAGGLWAANKARQAAGAAWRGTKNVAGRARDFITGRGGKNAGRQAGRTAARRGVLRGGLHVGGRLLGWGAAAVAGAAAAPAIATGLTVAGIAVTGAMIGHGIYKWAKSKGDQRRAMITQIRNEAYGVPEDKFKALVDYEDELAKAFEKDKPLDNSTTREYIKKFGLKPNDENHYKFFRHWFKTRFFPIFEASRNIFQEQFDVKFSNQHKLEDEQIEEYRKSLEESGEYQRLKSQSFQLTPEAAERWAKKTEPDAEEKTSGKKSTFPAVNSADQEARDHISKPLDDASRNKIHRPGNAPLMPALASTKYAFDDTGQSDDYVNFPNRGGVKTPSGRVHVTPTQTLDRKNAPLKSESDPEVSKQTGIMEQQNQLLSNIAEILNTMNQKTGEGRKDDDDPRARDLAVAPLLTKFDELLSVMRVSGQAAAEDGKDASPRAGDIRREQVREGGISFRKMQFQN